jgi:large subunit ribosomal protein L10
MTQREEVLMENPNADKVAVVEEVKARFTESDAVLLTEYRGLNVAAISELRRSLTAAGGDYKVYKNTLVGFATRELGLDLDDLLTGPTAIAFITTMPDGSPGDAVNVAKVLKDFSKSNPALVVKGGVLGEALLSADEAAALADVAPREELLARLAGGLAAPMVQFAGLLQALPRNFAYGLAALIDQQGGAPAPAEAEPEASDEPADAETADAESPQASDDTASDDTDSPQASDDTANNEPAEAPEVEASNDTTTDADAETADATTDTPEADTADADSPEASDDTSPEASDDNESEA